MSHTTNARIDLIEAINAAPIRRDKSFGRAMWMLVFIGILTFIVSFATYQRNLLWAAYYSIVVFFMGLSVGGVIIAAIFQIVRAKWSPPVRRLAEASSAFLPTAYVALLFTYLGRDTLFPWARGPMPGREWWMQPDFVYARIAILLGLLFLLLRKFVRWSLRGDIGLLREKAGDRELWKGLVYKNLTLNWMGLEKEIPVLQNKLSWYAPLIIALYAVIYSLFSFEMLMGMDTIWYSNMFGGFNFVGNIFIAFAALALTVICLVGYSPAYARTINKNQLWDTGKLMFGFCMMWGYLFFSQFLPQWYGNLPEETQWMILRSREYPWKSIGWLTFSLSFVIPFILLLSEDIKKTPKALRLVCYIILLGVFLEKYVVIMPQVSPEFVPLFTADGFLVTLGIFLGFLGAYVLSVRSFLAKFPFVPVSHPLTAGKSRW